MKPYASLQDVREDLYGFSRKFQANVPRMSLREGLSGTSPPWNIIHHISYFSIKHLQHVGNRMLA